MKQRILVSLVIAGLALVAVSAAMAATLTATATVSGSGTVSVNVPATATLTDTLDGTDQTVTYAPALGVADARGTGGGWNLTASATAFTDGTHSLGSGSISAVSQACHSGSTCTQATSSGFTYPLSLTTTANKFFSAASTSGLGKVDVTPTISVAIPGNAYAGTYSSTLTIAAAVGP
jgi:putative surface cell wall-binding protein